VTLSTTLPYTNTLHHGVSSDDFHAIVNNYDVVNSDVPMLSLFLHDFWGNATRLLPDAGASFARALLLGGV
jgi:hypothetical protein